jgi:hypothetical protein
VILDEPGYVSFDGQPTTSKPATVTSGSIQVVPFSYDAAATLNLEFVISDEVGDEYQEPVPPPSVTLFNASLPTMGKQEVDSGTSTVSGLWPFPDGYSVWAGTCVLNDPATTGGARATPVTPEPGETVTAEVELKPLTVTFLDDADLPLANMPVEATTVDTTGCEETEFDLGTTDENGVLQTALPYGQWTLTADTYQIAADMPADGSVTYPLELPLGGIG